MSNTGESSMFAALGGLLPLLVSIAVCLYPQNPATAEEIKTEDSLNSATDPPATLNLSIMPVPGAVWAPSWVQRT
jgi:hypothetical protein